MTTSVPSRTTTPQQSSLHIQPLTHPHCLNAIKTLATILDTSFGPRGQLKAVHNNRGGHVTVTSTCSRLLHTLAVSVPVLKLVTTAVQGHLDQYSDGGLLAGLLALRLVEAGLHTTLHRRLLIEVNELLLQLSVDYLQAQKPSECVVAVDTSHIDGLLSLISSVLTSKPGCQLRAAEVQHLTTLLLQAFVTSSVSSGRSSAHAVQYLCVEGPAPSQSHIDPGVLLKAPQFPAYRSSALTTVSRVGGVIRVACVGCSLSGDTEDLPHAQYELQGAAQVLTKAVLHHLSGFVQRLSQLCVAVVLCQKVIHPQVRRLMKERGILALDRLGLHTITATHALLGGKLISSWLPEVTADDLGHLGNVTLKTLGGQSYVHLEAASDLPLGPTTVVLCHRSEEALEELKHVCSVAQEAVGLTVRSSPWALLGAGCWQRCLAACLTHQVEQIKVKCSEKLGVSQLQFVNASTAFIDTLVNISARLHRNHGSDTDEQDNIGLSVYPNTSDSSCSTLPTAGQDMDKILDCFEAHLHALKVGVGTANLVLGINNYIQDVN